MDTPRDIRESTMMKLPRGITGFSHSSDAPIPTTNERQFQTACHAVARDLHGRVIQVGPVAHHRIESFSIITLQIGDRQASALLNAHYPFLALAEPVAVGEVTFTFIDWPSVSDEFARHGTYTFLTPPELSIACTQIDTSQLAEAECAQIKYWQPRTVGENIYNFWD